MLFCCCFACRSGQNTVELLAIADRRVAELNEEIRMLEKQVTKTTNLGNVGSLKLGGVDLCHLFISAITKTAMGTSNSPFVHLYMMENRPAYLVRATTETSAYYQN